VTHHGDDILNVNKEKGLFVECCK